MYIIDNICFYIFLEFFRHLHFVVIVLVQFCVFLDRIGMLYKKQREKIIKFGYHFFYYVIDTVYIYSWQKLIKFWFILVGFYVKRFFLIFIIACVVQLHNGVQPLGVVQMVWANQPTHSVLVGCLNPYLQGTRVRVVSPQPCSDIIEHKWLLLCKMLRSCEIVIPLRNFE